MKKLIIILLPLVLGIISIACTGLYISNHQQTRQIIRETKGSVPNEDFNRVVQQRLGREVSGVEGYHILSMVIAITAIIAAIVSCGTKWYKGLHPKMKVFRSLNLIFGFASLLISILRV